LGGSWFVLDHVKVAETDMFKAPLGFDRAIVIAVLCVDLTGCSVNMDSVAIPVNPGAPPVIADATSVIKKAAHDWNLDGPLEISNPVLANALSVAPWVICLRGQRVRRMFTYSLLFDGQRLVDSRPAAILDNCEAQVFSRL
jgi:hypothetical protein